MEDIMMCHAMMHWQNIDSENAQEDAARVGEKASLRQRHEYAEHSIMSFGPSCLNGDLCIKIQVLGRKTKRSKKNDL